MTTASLALNVTAKDETGGTLDGIAQKVDGITSAAKLMGEAFAVEQVFDFGKDLVSAGQTAISTINSTKQALLDAGLPAEMANQVQEASEKIGASAGVAGTDMQAAFNAGLAGSQATAAAFQSGAITIGQYTQAVADMSSKVTDGKNTAASLTTASKALGKALNDPATGAAGLKRAQIDLTAAQVDAIKTTEKQNGVAAAQQLMMQDVQAAVAGQTAATVPATAKMAASWENLKEQIGMALIPVINKLMDLLSGVMSFIQDHIGVITDLAEVLLPAAAAFMTVKLAIDATKAAQEMLDALWEEGSLTTMGWIGIILLVAIALVEAYEKCKTFRDIVNDVVHGVAAEFEFMWNAIKAVFDAFTGAVDDVINFVSDHWHLLLAILLGPFGLFIDAVQVHWDAIENGISDLVGWIKTAWDAVEPILLWPFQTAWNLLQPIFSRLENWVDAFMSGMRDLGGVIAAVWNGIESTISGVFNAIYDAYESSGIPQAISAVSSFAGGVSSFAGSVGSFFGFAEGGTVGQGGYAIVGENGPELALLPGGTQVIPNSAATVASRSTSVSMLNPQSAGVASMAGGGGGNLTLTVQGNSSDILVQMLRKYVRANGGNVQTVLGK